MATTSTDSCSPYVGTPGTPHIQEDPSKWRSLQINLRGLLARRNWTDEDYELARDFLGFPRPEWSGVGRDSLRWRLSKIKEWEERIVEMAKKLPR